MKENGKITTVGRRIMIMEQLECNGHVQVNELSEQLGVSEVTVRNDLVQLERKKMLIRARGGALRILQKEIGTEYPLSDKQKEHLTEKEKIGKKAAELISDGNTIILDSGSTTFQIVKHLAKFKDLTIITNALNIANQLTAFNFNVIIPGGNLRRNSLSLVGVLAEEGIKNFYCDKLFLGVDGFDTNHGLSTPSIDEAHLNQEMIRKAHEVIVVADSSKFKKRGFAFIGPISQINTVVTDEKIPEEDKTRLENAGVKVIIA